MELESALGLAARALGFGEQERRRMQNAVLYVVDEVDKARAQLGRIEAEITTTRELLAVLAKDQAAMRKVIETTGGPKEG